MSEVMNNTTLREAINNVSICGYLKKKELKLSDGKNGKFISGYLVIATGEHEEHRVDVMVSQLTSKNEENKAWKGIERVMNEYVSQAELMARGVSEEDAKAQATKLSTNAKLRLNDFYGRDGQLASSPRANSNFFSRVTDDRYAPCARFDLEGFVVSKRPEFKGEEETGRLIMELIVPGYKGVAMPMTFVVGTENNAASYIDDHYMVGNTVRVYGNMVNTVNVVTTRKAGFAREEVEQSTTYVNELLIDNGEPEPYDPESPKAYQPDAIRAAMRVRENEYLPAKKKEQEERASRGSAKPAPGNGFAAAPGNAPKATTGFSW